MTREEVNKMIECQDVYEIVYKKGQNERVWHISNIEMSKDYGEACILAYCREVDKDLCFNIKRIISSDNYWCGILRKDAVAPQEGIYVIARAGVG